MESLSSGTSMSAVKKSADPLQSGPQASSFHFADQPVRTPDAVFSPDFTPQRDTTEFVFPNNSIEEAAAQHLFDTEGLSNWPVFDVSNGCLLEKIPSFRIQDDVTWLPNNVENSFSQTVTTGDVPPCPKFQWNIPGCFTRGRISSDDSYSSSDDGFLHSEDSISDFQTVLDLLEDGNMKCELPCGSSSISNFLYGDMNYGTPSCTPSDNKCFAGTSNVSAAHGNTNEKMANEDYPELGLLWDLDDCSLSSANSHFE